MSPHVREAATAYAANTDAAFWDLFAAAGELLRLYDMPACQIENLMDAIEAQLNGEGYSMVEVMCSCPTNWNLSPIDAKKRLVDEVIPYYSLGEIKKRGE